MIRFATALAVVASVASVASIASAQDIACHEGRLEGDHIHWISTARRAGEPPYERRTSEQPYHEGAFELLPPLQAPLSRFVLVGETPPRFEPSAEHGVERRVGHSTSPSVDEHLRSEIDAFCGWVPLRHAPLYVAADDFPHGITGTMIGDRTRAREAAIIALMALAGASLVGAIAWRWLSRAAQNERVEEVLAKHAAEFGDWPLQDQVEPTSAPVDQRSPRRT
jgi:hypothetical protein